MVLRSVGGSTAPSTTAEPVFGYDGLTNSDSVVQANESSMKPTAGVIFEISELVKAGAAPGRRDTTTSRNEKME